MSVDIFHSIVFSRRRPMSEVARKYCNIQTDDNITGILFEIEIDTRLKNTKEYADIRLLSMINDEDEVLIMLGSILKIKHVEYDKEKGSWIAHLVLCSEDEFQLKDVFKQIKKETQAGVTSVGFLLYRQGKI